MPKILNAVIVIIALVILVGLFRQIADALQSGERLNKAIEEVSALQEDNKNLKKRLKVVESPDFMEEVARDKLNMAKSNETVILIDDKAINSVLGANTQKKEDDSNLPNWLGWFKLFFRSK